jgi:hypothetical protein
MEEGYRIQIIKRDRMVNEVMRYNLVHSLIAAFLAECLGPSTIALGLSLLPDEADVPMLKVFHRILKEWEKDEDEGLVAVHAKLQDPVWPLGATVDEFRTWFVEICNRVRGTKWEIPELVLLIKLHPIVKARYGDALAIYWKNECERMSTGGVQQLFELMKRQESQTTLTRELKPITSSTRNAAFVVTQKPRSKSSKSGQPNCRICKKPMIVPGYPVGAKSNSVR